MFHAFVNLKDWVDCKAVDKEEDEKLCVDVVAMLEKEVATVERLNMNKKRSICEGYLQEMAWKGPRYEEQLAFLIDAQSSDEDRTVHDDETDALVCSSCGEDTRFRDLIVICDGCECGWHQVRKTLQSCAQNA